MENKFLIFGILALVFVAGCTYSDSNSNKQPTPEQDRLIPPSDESGQQTTGEIKEFTITESNFRLNPETITVNKGDTVRITVVSDEGTHNLFIEEYNERTSTLSTGNSDVIEFIADTKGTFDIWCEIGNHRAQGMEGTLIVQ